MIRNFYKTWYLNCSVKHDSWIVVEVEVESEVIIIINYVLFSEPFYFLPLNFIQMFYIMKNILRFLTFVM